MKVIQSFENIVFLVKGNTEKIEITRQKDYQTRNNKIKVIKLLENAGFLVKETTEKT